FLRTGFFGGLLIRVGLARGRPRRFDRRLGGRTAGFGGRCGLGRIVLVSVFASVALIGCAAVAIAVGLIRIVAAPCRRALTKGQRSARAVGPGSAGER